MAGVRLTPARALRQARKVDVAAAPASGYRRFMSDRVFFTAAGVVAILMVALALVWPQGMGARSPGPFARPVEIPGYALKAAEKARVEAAQAQTLAQAQTQAQARATRPAAAGAPPR